jgi:hypothetical protein
MFRHIFVRYTITDRPKAQNREWTRNAINCATRLSSGHPIFFASDSADATTYAKVYGKEKSKPPYLTHGPMFGLAKAAGI